MALLDFLRTNTAPSEVVPEISEPPKPRRNVRRAYEALTTTLISNWHDSFDTPQNLIRSSQDLLITRARGLERTNPLVRRYLQLLEVLVVGDDGPRLSSLVTNDDGSPDELARQQIEIAWREWCEGKVTPDGATYLEMLNLFVRSRGRDGEGMLFLDDATKTIRVIDPLRVPVHMNSATCINGVEVDPAGFVKGYWVSEREDATSRPKLFPAENILHVYKRERPAQYRGVTALAPVMVNLELLHRYYRSELAAAQVSAKLRGFITRPVNPDVVPEDEERPPLIMDTDDIAAFELPEGFTFTEANPNHPVAAFGDFVNAIKKDIASGVGFSYDLLTSDLADVNFSSGKLGRQVDLANVRTHQQELIRDVCTPIFNWWLRLSVVDGTLNLPVSKLSRMGKHKFTPRAFDTVLRPEEEARAIETELRLGLTSLTRELRKRGSNIEAVIEERKAEKELLDAAGLSPAPAAEPPPASAPPERDEVDNDSDE